MSETEQSDAELSDVQLKLSALSLYLGTETESDLSSTSSDQSKKINSNPFSRYVNLAKSSDTSILITPSSDYSSCGSIPSIPSLDLELSLQSGTIDTIDTNTYRIAKKCFTPKLPHERAFEKWMAAKVIRKQHEDQIKKREKAEQQRQQEERKRQNELKLQEWEEKKRRELMMNKSSEKIIREIKTRNAAEEAQANYEAWCKRKDREMKKKRQEQKAAEERRQRELAERKRISDEAWQKWLREVPAKPKPVPLSYDFPSFSGALNKHFYNPNKWVHPNVESVDN